MCKSFHKVKLVLVNIRFRLDISMPVMVTNPGIRFGAWHYWLVYLHKHFSNMFNNITRIFTYFFTHTYFQKIQTKLLEQYYQTAPLFCITSSWYDVGDFFDSLGLMLFSLSLCECSNWTHEFIYFFY